ncbi:MAG: hypothetical protein ACRC78_07885 [Planktothrix sp.]
MIKTNPANLTVNSSPPKTQNPLPITYYLLPITQNPLPITHYPLPKTQNPKPITHYPLPITHYLL